MKAVIILGQNLNIKNYNIENCYIIGVERGCLLLIDNNIPFDLAIGDFDSISDDEYGLITKKCSNIIKLNNQKDNTDTLEALKKAYELCGDVTILGGLQGNRVEHLIANISLFKNYPNLLIIDDNSMIFSIDKDTTFYKNEYKYISFFAIEEVRELTLAEFKYPLNKYNLKQYDTICISNEIMGDARAIISDGQILVIRSK